MFDVDFFEKEIFLNSNRLKEKYIKNNFSEFHLFISDNFKGGSFLEKLYNFYKGSHLCYCGKNTKFINFKRGYLEYCSTSCSKNSEKTKEKYRNTCLDRYGVDNVSKSNIIKEKKEKTNLDRYGLKTILLSKSVKDIINLKYGVDNVFKSEYIKEKIKKTNIKKYGHHCSLINKEVSIKAKNTMYRKYGVDHFSKTSEWKDMISEVNLKKYLENLSISDEYEFISKEGNLNKIKHQGCGKIFEIQTQLIRIRNNKKSDICTFCNKITYYKENELFDYISTLTNTVEKYRDDKYEIDVYIPDMKLGFEFNGLYWHSEVFKDKEYHLNKTNYFKNKGIRIIHIWEDDWNFKSEIIKSIIKSNISIYSDVVYARNCKFIEISNKDSKKFLEENHLQGWCVSKYRYALEYNGEVVSLITLGSERLNMGKKKNPNNLELLRYVNKKNTNVIGGFSKLLKNSIKYISNSRDIQKIITYSDISIFNGCVYSKNGFNKIKETEPGYSYVINGVRVNRFSYNKQRLIKMGYDPEKTSREIMFENKHYRIYDCGNQKFEYDFLNQ